MLLKRDTIFATLFSIFIIGILELLTLNTHLFDPFKRAFQDFRYTDIYYSKLKKNNNVLFPEIVVVNIGKLSRADIAREIAIINQHSPRVIGIDAFFYKPKERTGDSLLAIALNNSGNIILASKFEQFDPGNNSFINLQKPFCIRGTAGSGFINIGSDYGSTSTIRYFVSHVNEGLDTVYSFASAISCRYNPSLKGAILKNDRLQSVVYSATGENFLILDSREVFSGSPKLQFVKDRIVLMGYLGEPFLSPTDFEDKHFTPYNEKISGRSNPDMYGVIINANIILMQLGGVRLYTVYTWVNAIISFIIIWLHIGVFLMFYIRRHKWYHVSTKMIQLFSSTLILLTVFYSYHYLHLYYDPTFTVIAVLLSVDLIYFYEGTMLLAKRWFRVKSIFTGQH